MGGPERPLERGEPTSAALLQKPAELTCLGVSVPTCTEESLLVWCEGEAGDRSFVVGRERVEGPSRLVANGRQVNMPSLKGTCQINAI